MPAQHVVGLADRVEIDDEARGFGGIFGEETRNPLIHQSGSSFRETAKQHGADVRRSRRRAHAEALSHAQACVRPNATPKTKPGPGPDRQISVA